jgi:hypothetical protein
MTITKSRVLFVTVALALAAGCSGSSQVAPSTAAPSSPAGEQSVNAQIAPGIYPAAAVAHKLLGKSKRISWILPDKKCKKSCYDLVVASANTYYNLDIFNGAPSPSYIETVSGVAGWGVASYGKDTLAWGSTAYGILVGNFSVSGSTLTLNETAQLTPSEFKKGYQALGIAYDRKGDLYGDDWPGACVDKWKKSTIAGYSGTALPPDQTFCSSQLVELYYLGIGKTAIYASGYDSSENSALDTIALNLSSEKITEDPINNPNGGFPGGVAVTKHNEVYVNDQLGTIYGFKNGTGSANQSVNWGYDPNDYSDINLDSSQKNLWAANLNFGSGEIPQIEDNSVPLKSVQTEGANGPESYEEYLGIAAVSAQK